MVITEVSPPRTMLVIAYLLRSLKTPWLLFRPKSLESCCGTPNMLIESRPYETIGNRRKPLQLLRRL